MNDCRVWFGLVFCLCWEYQEESPVSVGNIRKSFLSLLGISGGVSCLCWEYQEEFPVFLFLRDVASLSRVVPNAQAVNFLNCVFKICFLDLILSRDFVCALRDVVGLVLN